MQTLSFIASAIALILNLCEPFCNKMKQVLLLYFFANAFTGISYLLVGSISAGLLSFIAVFQIIINHIYNTKNKKIPLLLIVIYLITLYCVNLITFRNWYDLILLMTSTAFVLSMAQQKVKIYRILCITNISLFVLYDIIAGAYGISLTHSVQLAVVLTGVCIRYINNRKLKE